MKLGHSDLFKYIGVKGLVILTQNLKEVRTRGPLVLRALTSDLAFEKQILTKMTLTLNTNRVDRALSSFRGEVV